MEALNKCQICKKEKAEYDMKLLLMSGTAIWAYLCKICAKDQSYFGRLGEGIGQHHTKKSTCAPFCNGERIED